jgi:hypothetical protein
VHSIVDFGLHITINALVFVMLLAILSLRTMPRETSHSRRRSAHRSPALDDRVILS